MQAYFSLNEFVQGGELAALGEVGRLLLTIQMRLSRLEPHFPYNRTPLHLESILLCCDGIYRLSSCLAAKLPPKDDQATLDVLETVRSLMEEYHPNGAHVAKWKGKLVL